MTYSVFGDWVCCMSSDSRHVKLLSKTEDTRQHQIQGSIHQMMVLMNSVEQSSNFDPQVSEEIRGLVHTLMNNGIN